MKRRGNEKKERKRGRILGVLAVVHKPFFNLFVQAKIKNGPKFQLLSELY
jgi:hypothetical protein